MARILIGTPFKDFGPDNYIKSLVDMVIYTKDQGHEVEYVTEHGGLYDSRDRVCSKTIREKFDYMLQIDSDMTFPPDALCRLIDRMQANEDIHIITGVYVGKGTNHRPVLFTELHKDDADAGPYSRKEGLGKLMQNDLFTCAGCGAGFLMADVHILKLMMIHRKEWFKPYEGLGEDVSFCQRATEMGFKIYVDNTLTLGHTKLIEYTIDDWTGVEDD